MALLSTYNDYLELSNQTYNKTLEDTTIDNLFTKIKESDDYDKFGRYYYNKTGFTISDSNTILIAPKKGYMIQRLSYIGNDLTGGVKNGMQAIDIDSSDGKIILRNKGAIGQMPLLQVFLSLAYALGIKKIDTSKIDIYPVLNEALHDFEFLYFAPLNIARTITEANIGYIYCVFIAYNKRTYFDKELLQSLANAMFNAGWFTKYIVSDISDYVSGNNYSYNDNTKLLTYETLREQIENLVYGFSSSSVMPTNIKNSIRNSITTITNYLYNNISTELHNTNFPFFIESYYFPNTGEFAVKCIVAYNSNVDKRVISVLQNPDNNRPSLARCLLENSYNIINRCRYDVYYNSDGEITRDSSSNGNETNVIVYLGYYSNDTVYFSSNMGVTTQSVDGITFINNAVLPSGINSLETDYPEWFDVLERWTTTTVEALESLTKKIFRIVDFLPLNIIINTSLEYPTIEYEPWEVTTKTVLMPEIIPPQHTEDVNWKTLVKLPDDDDNEVDPTDPKTYEPLIDPKKPEEYPPNIFNININYPPQYNDPVINIDVSPSEPPSDNQGNISINPKPPTPSITATAGKLFSVFNPNTEKINSLGGFLWGENISGILANIFTNPLNAIISLHCVYCTPTIGSEKNIYLGYINTNITAPTVTSQYTEIDCGTIRLPEYYGDYRDYSPYTSISLYLPFIGFRQIKTDDVMGSELRVVYYVDVYTGSCLANVSIMKGGVNQLTYNFDGNCAVKLPVSSGSLDYLVGIITGAVTSVFNPVLGMSQMIGSVHNGATMNHQGNIGSNVGAMAYKKPYVVITNTQGYDAVGYNEVYGYPANIYTPLSQLSGYTRVKEVHVDNVSNATASEKNEIEMLLKNGVIIS